MPIGGLLIGAFAQIVGKQVGFLGGVVFCVARALAAAHEGRPAGCARTPVRRSPTPVAGVNYIPVAGD